LLALCEDDTTLGTRVLWNVARAMALRQRFILFQLQRAQQQRKATGPLTQPQAQPELVRK
jgi:hypothetical protein